MSVYMTETEQLEAIKTWWKRHQNTITVILSLILLVSAGVRYWHWHQNKRMQEASIVYEQMMAAFSNQDNKGVRAYANRLLSNENNTAYADAARLTLAKLYITSSKSTKAQELLSHVATHSHVASFQSMAKIRLARLLIAEKAFEKALAELATVDNTAYSPMVHELKGDIYTETGHYQQAVAAYQQATTESQERGIGNIFLEMKSSELAALAQPTQ